MAIQRKVNRKKKKQEQNSGGVAAPFFISRPSSSSLSEGATSTVLYMTLVKGSCVNVTQKMNSRCYKLHRTYSTSFTSTNVGDFFRS